MFLLVAVASSASGSEALAILLTYPEVGKPRMVFEDSVHRAGFKRKTKGFCDLVTCGLRSTLLLQQLSIEFKVNLRKAASTLYEVSNTKERFIAFAT